MTLHFITVSTCRVVESTRMLLQSGAGHIRFRCFLIHQGLNVIACTQDEFRHDALRNTCTAWVHARPLAGVDSWMACRCLSVDPYVDKVSLVGVGLSRYPSEDKWFKWSRNNVFEDTDRCRRAPPPLPPRGGEGANLMNVKSERAAQLPF